MNFLKNISLLFLCLAGCIILGSCNESSSTGKEKEISAEEKWDRAASESIHQSIAQLLLNEGKIDDHTRLKWLPWINELYSNNKYTHIWSRRGMWVNLADSMVDFIQKSELYGLFPNDYHYNDLHALKSTLDGDSIKRLDIELWTRADLMLTDGFMHLMKDIKVGRLIPDSTILHKNLSDSSTQFYISSLLSLLQNKSLTEFIVSIEPRHSGYLDLKKALPVFLDSMDRKEYTYINYPYNQKDKKDSLFFIQSIQKRLAESGCFEQTNKLPDSAQLVAAIKKYQKRKGLNQSGKISGSLVQVMNLTDEERYKRIAITLDRYKELPANFPEKYILVNLPGYYLKVWDQDTVALESRIICGKPETRTPLLYSVISDMVTYPTWTVPNSIIKKQYLPKLKNDPNYLTGIGLHLKNNKGEIVDPGSIDWSKYSTGIPFKVMQPSGDDNALGILKFNFKNPYSVYLHDTNQRYLFKNSSRALSHGCVRVQRWKELAYFIARNDSMKLKPGDTINYNVDSINSWLNKKEKRRIAVKNGIPLFIAYFSCEGKGHKIKFYEDIYGEDKVLRERFFSDK